MTRIRRIYEETMRAHPLLIPAALLAFAYVTNVFFFWKHGLDILDSDASSEMVLSALLNREGGILSPHWFYSTELRVLNNQIIYRLFLMMFPHNWHLARTLSGAVLVLIPVVCICDLSAVCGRLPAGLCISAAVISPVSPLYGSHIIYKCYYIPHIAITILTLSLLMRVFRENTTPRAEKISAFLVCLLAFAACLGGVRQLMVTYAPLWCAVIGLYVLRRGDREKLKKLFFLSTLLMVTGICGYFVNMKLLARAYTFADFSGNTLTGFSFEEILHALEAFIRLYGGWIGTEEPRFFSFTGAAYFLGLGLLALIVFSWLYLLARIRTIPLAAAVYTAFTSALFLSTLMILSQMGSSAGTGYWIPVMPFTFALPFMMMHFSSRERWYVPVILLFFVCAVSTMRMPQVTVFPSSDKMRNTADWLVKNGYTKGVSSFWYGNVMTELSDGDIEMWTVYEALMPKLEPYGWLQPTSHRTLPEGEFFLLVSDSAEPENGVFNNEIYQPYLVYGDGMYTVYAFESMEQFNTIH